MILNGSGKLLLKRESGRPAFAMGSLEGDGYSAYPPGGDDIEVGNNNLSATFGGQITGGATITKIGTGTLTLRMAPTPTLLELNANQGALLVSNTTGLAPEGR